MTTRRHLWLLYVFSKTASMLTMCLHEDALQWRSISRLLLALSFSTLSANFCPVAFLTHSTTLPLMPRPRTVSEILNSCVMGACEVRRLPRGWPITDSKSLLIDNSPASMVKMPRQQFWHWVPDLWLKLTKSESLKNSFLFGASCSVSSLFSCSSFPETTFLTFFTADLFKK